MAKIIQKKAKILSNVHLTGNYYRLAVDLPEVARVAQPGQFVMLRINQGYKPFLRRPFSIHRVGQESGVRSQESKIKKPYDLQLGTYDSIEILYEVVGKGTEILSQKKAGEHLDVIGPLGNGYPLPATRYSLIVGGGMGVAPLFFLAQRLIECYPLSAICCPLVLIGAKSRKEILSQKEFANLGLSVKISTDDGSAGFKGKVTELLRNILRKAHEARRTTIYACGPKSMLGEIAIISKQYNIPAQISLDEYMACGLGVCLGCMIETEGGYQRVCKEGPVFNSTVMIQQGRGRS